MVTRAQLNITLYVHCLSWLFFLSGEIEGELKVVPVRTLKSYSRNRGITPLILKAP